MMFDDAGFERNDKVTGREQGIRRDNNKPAEPLYDREVPLSGSSTAHSLLHDWLDGEVDVMRASEVEEIYDPEVGKGRGMLRRPLSAGKMRHSRRSPSRPAGRS